MFELLGVAKMLDQLSLNFEGRQHSGLDDATNIARIAIELLKVCLLR
jgi:inhibitor of KinA sporulation pathway (predicted exonuclease)